MKKTTFDPASLAATKTSNVLEDKRKSFFREICDQIKEEIDFEIRHGSSSAGFFVPNQYKDEFDATILQELFESGYKLAYVMLATDKERHVYRISWR